MPKKRTGKVRLVGERWQAFLSDGKWHKLSEEIGSDDREEAKRCAVLAQSLLDVRGYVPSERELTLNEYAHRWVAHRKATFPNSWRNDEINFRVHIAQALGTHPIAGLSKDAVEDFRDALNGRVASGAMAGGTADNVWMTLSALFNDACGGPRPLRVPGFERNLCRDVRPPDKGVVKEKQMLYPGEFLTLVGSDDVPIVYARIYAASVYMQTRMGELLPLAWPSVDLEHGRIEIHESADFIRGDGSKPKTTKSKRVRSFRIEPNLRPMLAAMRAESDGKGRLFPVAPRGNGGAGLAATLREHIRRAAGIRRAALTERIPTRHVITFHDLRATGITWRFKRGDVPLDVQEEVGHESFQTTERYIRRARGIEEAVFPPLPPRLWGETRSGRAAAEAEAKGTETVRVYQSAPKMPAYSMPMHGRGLPPEGDDLSGNAARPADPTVGKGTVRSGSTGAGTSAEEALAAALMLAAQAGQWEVVTYLSGQLEALRRPAAPSALTPAAPAPLKVVPGGRKGAR